MRANESEDVLAWKTCRDSVIVTLAMPKEESSGALYYVAEEWLAWRCLPPGNSPLLALSGLACHCPRRVCATRPAPRVAMGLRRRARLIA